MSQISPITAGTISVNTNLGKRANSAVIETEVKSLVTSLLNSNPNITEDQIRVEVNNYLQTIERNGTKIGKARITALAKLPETIRECRPKPVVRPTVIKPKPVMRTAEIPTESLIANSPIVRPEIVSTSSKKELKRVKRLNKQFGGGLSEVMPQGLSEQEIWEDEMKQKMVTTPPKSNKQNKKEVNSQYLSRKKQKLQKKQAEIQSQAEHKKARLKNTRTARNIDYCTRNGIISSEVKGAKDAYNLIQQTGEKTQTMRKEAMAVYPDNKPYVTKSAEESAKVFMENGFEPIVKQPEKNYRTNRNYTGGSSSYYQKGMSRNAASSAATASTTSTSITNAGKKEVVTEIKEVIKEVPKTNKWLIAGAVAGGGILGWLGRKIFDNNKQAS